MPGKPFAKPSPEQRAAFDAGLKKDVFKLLRRFGGAAVQHVAEDPSSPIGQVAIEVERTTGAFTVLARGLNTLMDDAEQVSAPSPEPPPPPAQQATPPPAAKAPPSPKPSPSAPPKSYGPGVIDAEYEDL